MSHRCLLCRVSNLKKCVNEVRCKLNAMKCRIMYRVFVRKGLTRSIQIIALPFKIYFQSNWCILCYFLLKSNSKTSVQKFLRVDLDNGVKLQNRTHLAYIVIAFNRFDTSITLGFSKFDSKSIILTNTGINRKEHPYSLHSNFEAWLPSCGA